MLINCYIIILHGISYTTYTYSYINCAKNFNIVTIAKINWKKLNFLPDTNCIYLLADLLYTLMYVLLVNKID